jgi:hypothetical protein
MRWIRVVFVGAVALWIAGLEGCGGKVVIDAESIGGAGGLGGAGGNGAVGGEGNSSTSSSGGNSCKEGTCSGTPDGSCDCAADCNGTEVHAACFNTGTAFSCACIVGGNIAAKCEGAAGTFACDVKVGCCAEFFP